MNAGYTGADSVDRLGDRRKATRTAVSIDGRVIWPGLFQPLSCKIVDVTDQGARLETLRSVHLPKTFVLIVDSENSATRVQLVWRRGSYAGVRFIEAPQRHSSR